MRQALGILKDIPLFDVGTGASPAGAPAGGGAAPAPEGGGGQPPAEGAPAPTPAPGEGTPPAAPNPDQEIEFVVDGQTQRVKLSELGSGYQRHADYTRKTQGLAEERRTFEADKTQQIQEGVQAEINRILAEQGRGGEAGAGGEGGGQPDPLSLLTSKVTTMEQRQADGELDRTMADLKGKYQGLDEKLLMLEASDKGVQKFSELDAMAKAQVETRSNQQGDALRAIMRDPEHPIGKELRDAVIKDYLAGSGNKPLIPPVGGGTPVPPADPAAPRDHYAIDDAALAALKARGG